MKGRAPGALIFSLLGALAVAGCSSVGGQGFHWEHTARPETGSALRVLWTKHLTGEFGGPFLPVEKASAALDPEHDRIYVGSTGGRLLAMDSAGRVIWSYRVGTGIEAAPALDPKHGDLYVAGTDGSLHALRAGDGSRLWKEGAGDAIRQAPLLTSDAVYVVTDSDRVIAFERKNGSMLWDYARKMPDGFSITGRAGLLLAHDELITGFTDGNVVALDPSDGHVLWARDTSLDLEEAEQGSQSVFTDVDTTPVIAGDTLYAASFSGGLYGLDPDSGSVKFRDPKLTGIVGLATTGPGGVLLLASADFGLMSIGIPGRQVRWHRPIERGSPTTPVIRGGMVFVGASDGSFLTLSLATGREMGRLDAGHGFDAKPALAESLGFVLSNGGTLFAFGI